PTKLSKDQLEQLIIEATNQLQKLDIRTLPYWITIELHTGTSAEISTLVEELLKYVNILAYLTSGHFLHLKLKSYQDLNNVNKLLKDDYQILIVGPPIETYGVIVQIPPDEKLDVILDLLLKYGSIDQYEIDGNYLYVLYDNEYNALKAVDDLTDKLNIAYE